MYLHRVIEKRPFNNKLNVRESRAVEVFPNFRLACKGVSFVLYMPVSVNLGMEKRTNVALLLVLCFHLLCGDVSCLFHYTVSLLRPQNSGTT